MTREFVMQLPPVGANSAQVARLSKEYVLPRTGRPAQACLLISSARLPLPTAMISISSGRATLPIVLKNAWRLGRVTAKKTTLAHRYCLGKDTPESRQIVDQFLKKSGIFRLYFSCGESKKWGATP